MKTVINLSHETIESAKKGDEEAFTRIVEAYQTPVYNLCYRMLYSERDAEEAAQETFWRVWTNLSRYDSGRPFATWVLSIAAHYCIDQQRKKRAPEVEISEEMEEILPVNAPLPEHEVMRMERERKLTELLNRLNEMDRAAMLLRYYHDFSEKEIAESLAITESAVKSRLFRARRQLAKLWEGEGL